MEWKDVIAKAPTGTGKTFAFGIPMVEHIDPECADVQGLVLAPTRELAVQIQEELRDLCEFKEGVRTVCLYGGAPIDRQINTLKKKPQIVVATPGRLMDHMKRRTVRLDKVQTVVLDEADRMLDMGFVRDVTRILDQLKHRRNLGMFSATISREVMDISWVYQRDPVEITVRPVEESKPDITQYRIDLDGREQKLDTIAALITHGEYERAIAFCNTKNMTDRLAGLLKMRGISCEAIHGDIQQRIREKTLEKFKRGRDQGAGGHRRGRPRPGHRRRGRGVQLRRARRAGELHPPHRPHRPGQAPRRGLHLHRHHHRGHPHGRYRAQHQGGGAAAQIRRRRLPHAGGGRQIIFMDF